MFFGSQLENIKNIGKSIGPHPEPLDPELSVANVALCQVKEEFLWNALSLPNRKTYEIESQPSSLSIRYRCIQTHEAGILG